ncbi:DUF2330 domain-containing protein [Thermobifida halotolerans]|uniref:DUF2330 domain-containing protein n=1 Tax=Thermobifida halotolerans TaxID=483545 RepID=A0AA97M5A5_9ACTN|nr:DUF2330 domain-containing protein [Thermobifida halotolerans]UOE20777.1 DUF2330 domain-containing protein [Thermobifida halotolerans]
MRAAVRRGSAVVAVTVLAVAAGWAAPSWACGCGAMVGDVDVYGESTVVHFADGVQTVVLQLEARSQDSAAALLLPTPAPAEVALGDAAVFEELGEVSAPRTEYVDRWWPSGEGAVAGAPAGGVAVLDRVGLGPFDAATLAADDAAALHDWLDDNGFALEDDLAEALEPYVAEGWYYVAVRLDAEKAALSGALEPVEVTFPATELVYPMRLTALSDRGQYARLYLLADHRMDRVDDVPVDSRLRFAGRLTAADVESERLRDLVGSDGVFLTTLDHDIWDPSELTGDFVFAPAADDTPYQEVVRMERTVRILGFPAGPFSVVLGALTLLVAGVLVARLVAGARR